MTKQTQKPLTLEQAEALYWEQKRRENEDRKAAGWPVIKEWVGE